MGKRKTKKPMVYMRRVNRFARWADRSVSWWKGAMDGWDKFCSGVIKLCYCAAIMGMILNSEQLMKSVIKYGPEIRTALSA